MALNSGKKSALFPRLISQLFGVQEKNVPRIALMFLYSLLAVGSFILGRIIRDILLLSLPHAQVKAALPTVIGISAITVSFCSFWYSRFAHKLRRDRMIMLINSILALSMVLIYVAFLTFPKSDSLLKLNYIFVEVMGSLQVIQFWTLASELFTSREAKRSFAIIGGGAVLANLLAFGIRPLVKALDGAVHLLPMLAGMLVVCVFIVYLLGIQNQDALTQMREKKKKKKKGNKSSKSTQETEQSIWKNKHLLIVAGIIVVTFLTTTIVDYQFKSAAAKAFESSPKEELASYFSMFYGITGIIACIIQFVLANRILERAGIRFALLLLPFALLGGSVFFAFAPMALVIWASTIAKGSENVLRYTINDVSLNLLYVPVASDLRARAKPFIDGILKPGAIGLSAGLIAFLSSVGMKVQHFSWLSLCLLGGWLVLIFQAHKEYIRTLMDSMGSKGLDLEASVISIKDDAAIKALRDVLQSENTDEIRHAMELLPHIPDVKFEEELADLLSYPDDIIKTQALKLLATSTNKSLGRKVAYLKEDPNPDIRAEAIETLCAIMTDEAIDEVVSHLKDDSLKVRISTIVGLIQHGGLDGILNAASDLKELLDNEDPEKRKVGAQVLGKLAITNYYQPILRLLEDPDIKVQVAALEAAGSLKTPKLLPTLFEKVGIRETAQYSARAIIQYGHHIFDEVSNVFSESENSTQIVYLARVLTSIGGQRSFDVLSERLFRTDDRAVRYRLLYAMQRILSHHPEVSYSEKPFLDLLQSEFRAYYRFAVDHVHVTKQLQAPTTFEEAVKELKDAVLQQIFELLALLYPPPRQIRMIAFQIEDGSARLKANAIELLDNLLSSEVSRPLLPILDEVADLSSLAKDFYGFEPESVEQVYERLLVKASPSLRSLLLWSIGENKLQSHLELVKNSLKSDEPIIRETCLLALGELLPQDDFSSILKDLKGDDSTHVAKYAQFKYDALTSTT